MSCSSTSEEGTVPPDSKPETGADDLDPIEQESVLPDEDLTSTESYMERTALGTRGEVQDAGELNSLAEAAEKELRDLEALWKEEEGDEQQALSIRASPAVSKRKTYQVRGQKGVVVLPVRRKFMKIDGFLSVTCK